MERFASERFWGPGHNARKPDPSFLRALGHYDKSLVVRWDNRAAAWEIGLARPQDRDGSHPFYPLFTARQLGGEVFEKLDARDMHKEGPQLWAKRYVESKRRQRQDAARATASLTDDYAHEVADHLHSKAPDAL